MKTLSWQTNQNTMGVTALCVGSSAGMLTAFCPPLFTIRNLNPTPANKANLRLGMALGSGLSLVIGLGGSAVSGSWWPLFGTILSLVILCGAYEWGLRHPQKEG